MQRPSRELESLAALPNIHKGLPRMRSRATVSLDLPLPIEKNSYSEGAQLKCPARPALLSFTVSQSLCNNPQGARRANRDKLPLRAPGGMSSATGASRHPRPEKTECLQPPPLPVHPCSHSLLGSRSTRTTKRSERERERVKPRMHCLRACYCVAPPSHILACFE